SPVPRKNGYLLDLEFYGRETPLGSTEFAVTQVIQQLVSEGYTYLSLGGTFGTELEDGEGGDLEVTKLLREMALANKLHGDAHFQYERKFGGETGRMYLCRTARGADTTLTDVLEMLASTSRSGAARRTRDDEGKSVPAEEIVVQLNSGGYLKDHRLDGRTFFPGAGYISFALGSLPNSGGIIELRDLVIERPLICDDGLALKITRRPESDGLCALTISTADASGQRQETLHASGSMVQRQSRQVSSARVTLQELQARITRDVDIGAAYAKLSRLGYGYGPFFRTIRKICVVSGEALGYVVLEARADDPDVHAVHPSLLDGCLQLLPILCLDAISTPYVMTGLEVARLHRRPGLAVFAWARVRKGQGDGRTIVADLSLFDPNGELLLELEGITAYETRSPRAPIRSQTGISPSLFLPVWNNARLGEVPSRRNRAQERSDWFVFVDDCGFGEGVADALESRGGRCWRIGRGTCFARLSERRFVLAADATEDFQRLIATWRAEGGRLRGVVHLWSLDADVSDDAGEQGLAAATRLSCGSALHALQALATAGFALAPKLWIVTRRAQAVSGGATAVAQAPVWGLGRVAANEHPDIWGGLVDVEGLEQDKGALADELCTGGGEDWVAYRGGERYVARLRQSVLPPPPAAGMLHRSGTYLITGGLG